jgi:hypothetical protein
MKMDGFRISELGYLSDEKFNNVVFSVEDPVSFEVSAGTIASIIKTSDIIKVDNRKDALVFYVEDKSVYVKDFISKDKAPNFVYKIGELETAPEYEIKASIFREKFIDMMDKTEDNYKVILGRRTTPSGGYIVDRILFDSLSSSTKVVISIINEE